MALLVALFPRADLLLEGIKRAREGHHGGALSFPLLSLLTLNGAKTAPGVFT